MAATAPEKCPLTLFQPCGGRQPGLSKEGSTIIDGAGDADGIQARIKQIKAQIEEISSDYDREKRQRKAPADSGHRPAEPSGKAPSAGNFRSAFGAHPLLPPQRHGDRRHAAERARAARVRA
jgi:hypothetical protein